MKRAGWALVVTAVVMACSGPKAAEEKKKDLGKQMADVTSDTKALGEAQAAVNEVLRSTGDCDAAKALIPEAYKKLDEVQPRVRTLTGREMIETLRKQVRTVADACP